MIEGMDDRSMVTINEFKAQKRMESLICVVDSTEAQRIVAVWPLVRKRWYPPDSPCDAWDDLWESVDVSIADIATASGLSRSRADVAFSMLVDARVIYPDGTVMPEAESIVRRRIRDALVLGGKNVS